MGGGVLIGVIFTLFLQLTKKDTQLSDYKKQFDTYQETVVKPALLLAEANKKSADSAISISDSAKKVAASKTQVINQLKKEVTKISNDNKILKDSLLNNVTPEQEETCAPFISLIKNQDVEIKKQDSIITKQDERHVADSVAVFNATFGFNKERARGDSLQKVINEFPKPVVKNKFLGFIPMPGPRMMFLGGLITGAVVWDVIKDKSR